MEDLPVNVQSKVMQVIAEMEPDPFKRHSFVADGPFLSSVEAREGLAKGLRSNYYDGLADVTLDWFRHETHAPVRELLAEHFSTFASECPPYEEMALAILESEPGLKPRLLLGAEGKPIYRILRAQDIRAGTGDLFGDELQDDITSRLAAQTLSELDSEKTMKKKVLILLASPMDQGRLRIDEECRDLDEKLRLVKDPEYEIVVKFAMAVRTDQIQDAVLNEKPEILHFSGHGGGGKLCFENAIGETAEVSGEALAELVELNKDCIRCVVLSACYSEKIGHLFRPHVECVVGCDGSIDDRAAIAFTRAFYRALAIGKNYQEAFKHARNEIKLAGMKSDAEKYIRL